MSQEMTINLLMEITELNYAQSDILLSRYNYNLEAALNYHLDGNNVFPGNSESEQATAGTSSGSLSSSSTATSNDLIQDDDNTRSPIPPKREILLLPDEDNFRFRKRRNISHNICPLRNFEREGELQEQMLAENQSILPTTMRHTKRARLADLFLPPIDLSFCGSFQAARDYATAQNRWLIVNLQDNTEFASQVLNRDIWSEQNVVDMIKKYFVFWQIGIDNTEGARFKSFYSANIIPYVCIIDPRTGEEKLGYKTVFKFSAKEFVIELRNYMREHSPIVTLPNIPYGGIYDVHFNDLNIEDNNSGPSTSSSSASSSLLSTSHINSVTKTKKYKKIIKSQMKIKRENLTESEQLAIAIQNSINEKKKNDIIEISDSDDGFDLTKDDDDDLDDVINKKELLNIKEINFLPKTKINDVDDDNDDDDDDVVDNDVDVNNKTTTTTTTINKVNQLIEEPSNSAPCTTIILRLPDNTRETIEWPNTTKLLALINYIKKNYPDITKKPYKIMCPFLKQDLLLMNDNLTLEDASLHPSVILHIQPDN